MSTPASEPLTAGPERRTIRREQFRQAKRIHKGLRGLALAVLGVKLSRLPIPSKRLRNRLFRDLYTKLYPPGLNEAEAELPLTEYDSFNALFTRGLKPESRPISQGEGEVVSPCDGTVQDVGRVEQGRLVTVKGIEYTVGNLLASDAAAFEGGAFATLFLSPIDCHRVFSPVDGEINEVTHVPGSRLLVHPPFQTAEFPVYTLNERVVFRLSTSSGECAVVMVAGWGVGHITLPMAADFQKDAKRSTTKRWGSPETVKRGCWVGTFELGSTVVLIHAGRSTTTLVQPNEKVRYGQPVFRVDNLDHAGGVDADDCPG